MSITYFLSICLYFIFNITLIEMTDNSNLIRRKRYIAFPEGATLSVALCITINTISAVPTIFTEGINWGVSYDLPNVTFAQNISNSYKAVHQRRSRREIYNKIETIINSMGLDGRSCISRTLCEMEQKKDYFGGSMIERILKVIFRYPVQGIYHFEPEIHRFYRRSRELGRMRRSCDSLFPSCEFSLLDLILNLAIENF